MNRELISPLGKCFRGTDDVFTVVRSSCDGVSIEAITRETLLKRLDERYWGDVKPRVLAPETTIDLRAETTFFIVPGRPIIPVPEKVVEKWRLP